MKISRFIPEHRLDAPDRAQQRPGSVTGVP